MLLVRDFLRLLLDRGGKSRHLGLQTVHLRAELGDALFLLGHRAPETGHHLLQPCDLDPVLLQSGIQHLDTVLGALDRALEHRDALEHLVVDRGGNLHFGLALGRDTT